MTETETLLKQLTGRLRAETVIIINLSAAESQVTALVALTCVVVEEADVSILLRRDADGQRGVTEHPVDLAGLLCGNGGRTGGRFGTR